MDSGKASSPQVHDDGVLMASGLKTAAKCRECARTLDVGSSAWFNKEGTLGKKITCNDCHLRKLDNTNQAAPEVELPKKQPKRYAVWNRAYILTESINAAY